MPSSLPRSTPADQRVDPAAILSFLDAVDERPGVEMHSLMVVRHGRVVAEGWWAPWCLPPSGGQFPWQAMPSLVAASAGWIERKSGSSAIRRGRVEWLRG